MGISLGRLAAGVATGGLSEAYRGINKLNESPQDKKARELASNAAAGYEDLKDQIPGYQQRVDPITGVPIGDPTYDQSLSFSDNPLDPNYATADLKGYQQGPELQHQGIAYADPGQTSWQDATSAFGGTSDAWNGASSAYDQFAPDQAGRNAAMGAGGYLANVASGGPDAQAEADYARRAKQAELSRRANSEGALQSLEQQGRGGSGDALLAQLVNNQGAASDRYQAGLDTNAIAQARRDSAATQYGQLGSQLYGQDVNVANAKAGGQDRFAAQRAQGQNQFGIAQAGGQDQFAGNRNNATDQWNATNNANNIGVSEFNANTHNDAADQNFGRANSVSDANTALGNTAGQWNATGQQQQRFENQLNLAGGQAGASNNAAQIYAGTAQHPFTDWVLPTAGAVTKAAAPTPK